MMMDVGCPVTDANYKCRMQNYELELVDFNLINC